MHVKEHTARLEAWPQRIEMLLSSLGNDLTADEEETIYELPIMHLSSLMWLGTALGCTSAEAKERFDSIVGVADAPQDSRYHRGLPIN
jgi:hypothetical protein